MICFIYFLQCTIDFICLCSLLLLEVAWTVRSFRVCQLIGALGLLQTSPSHTCNVCYVYGVVTSLLPDFGDLSSAPNPTSRPTCRRTWESSASPLACPQSRPAAQHSSRNCCLWGSQEVGRVLSRSAHCAVCIPQGAFEDESRGLRSRQPGSAAGLRHHGHVGGA